MFKNIGGTVAQRVAKQTSPTMYLLSISIYCMIVLATGCTAWMSLAVAVIVIL